MLPGAPLPTSWTACGEIADLRQTVAIRAPVDGDHVMVGDSRSAHRHADIEEIGIGLANRFPDPTPDLILTANASGIPPALAGAGQLGLPVIYTKKLPRSWEIVTPSPPRWPRRSCRRRLPSEYDLAGGAVNRLMKTPASRWSALRWLVARTRHQGGRPYRDRDRPKNHPLCGAGPGDGNSSRSDAERLRS